MFVVNEDKSIYVTRGDAVFFTITADDNGVDYTFAPGDVVRIKVYGKKDASNVVLQKDFPIVEETQKVDILLNERDTKIGAVISKPADYWYEIELNPFTNPQTIIGYDEDGAKIFRLYPEGKDLTTEIKEEDIPPVDAELSLTSERPVQNQAVTRKFYELAEQIGAGSATSWEDIKDKPFSKETDPAVYKVSAFEQLSSPKDGAEDYSYGTFLFEAEKIPGSAEAFFSIDGSTRTVPISELNGYQQGRFSIWGSTFCIYCEMNRFGRYDIYALAKSNSTYGAELHFKNFAYIDHLPTEYINASELKNILGLPATWASMPDKPFNVVEQPVNYPIQGFTANTGYWAETYPYISALITTAQSVPNFVDITAFGNYTLAVRGSDNNGFISDTLSSGPVRESAVSFEPNNSGGWDVYVLSKSAWTDSWGGYVSSFSYATPLNFKVLPMDYIIAAVKEALGL